MEKMMNVARRFLADEKGTEIVEWAIVGGLIVAVGAGIFVTVGDDAGTALGKMSDAVSTAAGDAPAQ